MSNPMETWGFLLSKIV